LNKPIQDEPSELPKKKQKTNSNSFDVEDLPLYLENSEYTTAIEELHQKMALPKPGPKEIKQHLLNTFRKWITESFSPVLEVLDIYIYPCFREHRWAYICFEI